MGALLSVVLPAAEGSLTKEESVNGHSCLLQRARSQRKSQSTGTPACCRGLAHKESVNVHSCLLQRARSQRVSQRALLPAAEGSLTKEESVNVHHQHLLLRTCHSHQPSATATLLSQQHQHQGNSQKAQMTISVFKRKVCMHTAL